MIKIGDEITTIIWDLDGTLLDSVGVLEDVLTQVLPRHGYRVPSHDLILKNFHGSLEDVISNILPGIKSEQLKLILKDFLMIQDTYYEMADDHVFPDALAFAKRAHKAGKQQILITNRSHTGRLKASPRSLIEHSKLRKYIDIIICGDDSPHRKPQPAVLGDLKILAGKAIVVGDQFVDIEFAYNLGSKAIVVSRDGLALPHLELLPEQARLNATFVSTLELISF